MTALPTLITNLRILGQDTPTSNLINRENLKPNPDGTRTKFYVDNKPIVGTDSDTNSVYVTSGNTDAGFRSQSGFTVDLANAIITFAVAPANGVTPFVADYNFYWFSDTDYTEFLNEASKQCSASDPTQVQTGLEPAMMQFALYYYWMRRATQWANKYSSTGGLASQSADQVAKNFHMLAKEAWAAGEKERLEFYKNQGQNVKAATSVINYGIDPYTPIR